MKISVETSIKAPIDVIWAAYTTPEDIVQWNSASDDWHTTKATVDLKVGGSFSSWMEAKDGSSGFDFAGRYVKIIPLKLIAYSFGNRTGVVEFIQEDGAITVRVTFDAEDENPIELQRDGWQKILDNFAKHVLKRT